MRLKSRKEARWYLAVEMELLHTLLSGTLEMIRLSG